MRFIASVLCACALAVSVEPAPPGEASCVQSPRRGVQTMSLFLRSEANGCVDALAASRAGDASAANTAEQLRAVFRRSCAAREGLAECLSRVGADAQTCLEGADRTSSDLHLRFLATVYDVTCRDGGERSADIYEARRDLETDDVVGNCSQMARSIMAPLKADHATDPNRDMYQEYRMLIDLKECLEEHRGGEQDTLVDAQVAEWSDTIDRIKCVDPRDGTEVLCKTVFEADNN